MLELTQQLNKCHTHRTIKQEPHTHTTKTHTKQVNKSHTYTTKTEGTRREVRSKLKKKKKKEKRLDKTKGGRLGEWPTTRENNQ